MYTYEDNVLAGLYEQGIFWWKTTRYEAKLKIGRTEQHPFRRIDQQLDTRTNIPDPPILLAALWTNLVAPCERSIHIELKEQGKRLTDSRGDDAKGGVEWFKDTPTESLPTIHKWVKYYRVIEGTLPNKVIVKQVYFSENVITLLHINGWLELPRPEIFSVKIKSTSHIIIRLRDRRRCVLNLLSLENKELDFAMHILLKNLYLIKNNGTHKTYMS